MISISAIPTCSEPSIANAELLNNATEYKRGDVAVFQCVSGTEAVVVEDNKLTCNSSGLWQGNQLQCQGNFF